MGCCCCTGWVTCDWYTRGQAAEPGVAPAAKTALRQRVGRPESAGRGEQPTRELRQHPVGQRTVSVVACSSTKRSSKSGRSAERNRRRLPAHQRRQRSRSATSVLKDLVTSTRTCTDSGSKVGNEATIQIKRHSQVREMKLDLNDVCKHTCMRVYSSLNLFGVVRTSKVTCLWSVERAKMRN